MKSEKNILIAFILNLGFSVFEFIGGLLTNSISIISDSIHDLGDSLSIGVSYFLEKKSKKKPNLKYTFGYVRYSVIGSLITTVILLVGSIFVIYNAINRIINPVDINYDGMIIFAIVGIIVNVLAAYFTKDGHSLNQKSVNLHMLEDVLGWIVVFIGAIVMKFTDIKIIDAILSILVAIFIFINAIKNLKQILDLILEKTPSNIDIIELKKHLLEIKEIKDIHHVHVWCTDDINIYATMHVVTDGEYKEIKHKVKEELKHHGINHSIIELEDIDELCGDDECVIEHEVTHHHHH